MSTQLQKLIVAQAALQALAGTPDVLGLHGFVEGYGHRPILPEALESLTHSIDAARKAADMVPLTAHDKAKAAAVRVQEAVTALGMAARGAREDGVKVTLEVTERQTMGQRYVTEVTAECVLPL